MTLSGTRRAKSGARQKPLSRDDISTPLKHIFKAGRCIQHRWLMPRNQAQRGISFLSNCATIFSGNILLLLRGQLATEKLDFFSLGIELELEIFDQLGLSGTRGQCAQGLRC